MYPAAANCTANDSINTGVQLLEAFGREVIASTYDITRFSTEYTVAGIKQLAKSLSEQIVRAQDFGPLARAGEYRDRVAAVVSTALDCTTMTADQLRELDPYTLKREDHLLRPEIQVFAHMHWIS